MATSVKKKRFTKLKLLGVISTIFIACFCFFGLKPKASTFEEQIATPNLFSITGQRYESNNGSIVSVSPDYTQINLVAGQGGLILDDLMVMYKSPGSVPLNKGANNYLLYALFFYAPNGFPYTSSTDFVSMYIFNSDTDTSASNELYYRTYAFNEIFRVDANFAYIYYYITFSGDDYLVPAVEFLSTGKELLPSYSCIPVFRYFSTSAIQSANVSDITFSGILKYDYSAYQRGYQNGYSAGYQNGYDVGFTNGRDSVDTSVISNNAYNQGYNAGIRAGYDVGYQEGYQAGANGGATLVQPITAIIDIPINLAKGIFNFEILGVNLSNFLLSLITVLFVISVLRKIL